MNPSELVVFTDIVGSRKEEKEKLLKIEGLLFCSLRF